jgi:hypothetical protein
VAIEAEVAHSPLSEQAAEPLADGRKRNGGDGLRLPCDPVRPLRRMHDLRGARIGAQHNDSACSALLPGIHSHEKIRP